MARKELDAPGPWLPYIEEDEERRALQALFDGVANKGQQATALETIFQICDLDGLSYRPGSERDTAFAEGKRFVGLQILKIIKTREKVNQNG
jgi:hypothetical protein